MRPRNVGQPPHPYPNTVPHQPQSNRRKGVLVRIWHGGRQRPIRAHRRPQLAGREQRGHARHSSEGQPLPSAPTALAMTSSEGISAAVACIPIRIWARDVSGMVSVGLRHWSSSSTGSGSERKWVSNQLSRSTRRTPRPRCPGFHPACTEIDERQSPGGGFGCGTPGRHDRTPSRATRMR